MVFRFEEARNCLAVMGVWVDRNALHVSTVADNFEHDIFTIRGFSPTNGQGPNRHPLGLNTRVKAGRAASAKRTRGSERFRDRDAKQNIAWLERWCGRRSASPPVAFLNAAAARPPVGLQKQ